MMYINYLIYPLVISFTISFILYSKYQFEDVKLGWSKAKGKWHVYGALMRIIFILSLILQVYFPAKLIDIILSTLISLPLWDIGINKIALGYKWNYIGTNSKIDRIAGKSKWIIYAILIIVIIAIRWIFHK